MTEQVLVENKAAGPAGAPKPEEVPEQTSAKGPRDGEPTEKPPKTYEIDIFRDWCKSCGICAAFCPKHCIRMDEEGCPAVDPSARCSGCGWCEVHCPDFAISVRPVKEGKARGSEEEVC